MMVDSQQTKNKIDFGDLIIRQVEKADLPALEWDGEYSKFRRMYASLYRDAVAGRALMWIIETLQGQMVGQAFVVLRSGEIAAADGERRAYIFSFRVKPAYRNKGLGTGLLEFIHDDLRQRGFQFVTLNVAKDNSDALRLYLRLGYKVISAHPGKWSYTDHEGITHHVDEPAWRMLKRLGK
jgi:ribosomal protein S18 acetylase RimI-like enzyme